MKILFYYPSNKRSNSLETLMEELSLKGFEMILLTTCERGQFHDALEQKGIKTYSNPIKYKNSLLYYFQQVKFLISFCKSNKIDLVCSHLQHANFIAVFSQFFLKAKLIVFRHHFQFTKISNDKVVQTNRMERMFDKVINKLAKNIVVPSTGVYNGILRFEAINEQKLHILPYIYNFDNYSKVNPERVKQIREEFNCQLRLLMCSRLIKLKRHYLVFPIVKKLIDEGFSIKLFVLDDGPEREDLANYIKENKLDNSIFLLGFKTEFVDYMAASDLLIHPSLSDASSSAVKEMGLLERAVAVCSEVGDFDDYIVHNQNGFLMPVVNTEVAIENLIREHYNRMDKLGEVGRNLKQTVLQKFNKSEEIVTMYQDYFKRVQDKK